MKLLLLVAGLASMRSALERHDLDEAARQGMLAGPAVVGQALRAHDRMTQLAGIAAAPGVEDRAELLPALAALATGPDRRTAIPAARAAREIARGTRVTDDLPADELAAWHDRWLAISARTDRWIEVRVLALDTAAALGDVPISADADPALRIASIELQPVPIPASARATLVAVIVKDLDDRVARTAARVLCADLATDPAQPILDALGPEGLARIKALPAPLGEAQRCLKRQ